MRKRYEFGEYAPDLPPSGQIIRAEGVYSITGGYGPVGAFSSFTTSLNGFIDAGAFVGSDGTAALLAGNSTALYRHSSSSWSSLIGSLTATAWRFAQFGDNVICANGGPLVSYDILAGTAATAGSPPDSDMVAVVRDFVVVAGDPGNILRLSWSGFNNSAQWTAGTNQSDVQDMLSGGEIMGLAGGEYGIILQREAIKRMTYVGGDVIFQFDEIESNLGCMAKGSVAQVGRFVFFLSERGFMVCDGSSATPVGFEKIDAAFFDTYSRQDIVTDISAAVDPRRYLVAWAMRDRLWVLNWKTGRWTTIPGNFKAVFSGFTSNISLDALDALYPAGLESIPYSLDDIRFAGGAPLFFAVDAGGEIGTLSGAPMQARITVARIDFGQRMKGRSMRLVSDAVNASVSLACRDRSGDSARTTEGATVRRNGEIPVRFNTRHLEPEITIPAGEEWTYAQGFDLTAEPAGRL